MSEINHVGDLEIDQDMDFQHKEWRVERLGWILMLLFLIAGLLGLFGEGPLSDATAGTGQLQVQYGRFERLLAPTQYNVQTAPQGAENGEVRLHVDRKILSFYIVQRIVPEPDSSELSNDQITYVFKAGQGGPPLIINFYLQSNKLGLVKGKIGLENGPAVDISQFIYP